MGAPMSAPHELLEPQNNGKLYQQLQCAADFDAQEPRKKSMCAQSCITILVCKRLMAQKTEVLAVASV